MFGDYKEWIKLGKISFKIDEVRNKTTIRISKNSYPYSFINFLKEKDDFDFVTTNRINHVFNYNGTIENAEFYFKAHLVTFSNFRKKDWWNIL